MKRLDENVYVDQQGVQYIKIRSVGYELYGYMKDDGTYGYCGGFVGPSAGWKLIEPKDQEKEDQEFKDAIERAALRSR